MIRFIHAADFHLDSPFSALPPRRAAERRRESRGLPQKLAERANEYGADLVLLSGDLLDGARTYRETAETLRDALGTIRAPVFIAPGNHDFYGPGSLYASMEWPENVHIFRTGKMERVELPELHAAVYGAAFTGPEQGTSLLSGFRAPDDGEVPIMVLHGELQGPEARYNPITKDEAAASGLKYLALGHIHKRGEARCGKTLCAWPGCPEGRGFDELGEKGYYEGVIDDAGTVTLTFRPLAGRRYEIVEADVSGQDPLSAIEAAVPKDTKGDLYRILLTGETGEGGVNLDALRDALEDRFYALDLRDRTRPAESVWARAEEDSLRGIFLRELRRRWDEAGSEQEQETIRSAARFGLAALDHRDL